MATSPKGPSLLEKMRQAVAAVRDRLERVIAALEASGIEYVVVGGNAVAAWVASKDRAAVRNTQAVDLILRRTDLDAAAEVLAQAGFIRHETLGVEMFLDGPSANPRDAVHILFAREKVYPNDAVPAPDVVQFDPSIDEEFRVVSLEPLVQMKLTSYRRKDQVHIQDMIGVGLIDASWVARFPPPLDKRLQELLDDPTG